MSTDIYGPDYGDEATTPPETSFTLGNRGDDLGVWVTTTVSDDRVFIPLREIREINIALGALKTAVAALRNIGISLSAIPNLRPQLHNSDSEEFDGTSDLCDRLIGLVALDEPSPFDSLLGGALGTADSFEDTHDSSLSGHGADPVSAPTASTEAVTSADGDTVRDGTDMVPGSDSPVEQSVATGAAASARPHPSSMKNAGAA